MAHRNSINVLRFKRKLNEKREKAECPFWQAAMHFSFVLRSCIHPFAVRACAHRLRSSIQLPLYKNRNECLLLCLWRVDLLFLMLLLIFISALLHSSYLAVARSHVFTFIHHTIRSESFAAEYYMYLFVSLFLSSLILQLLHWVARLARVRTLHWNAICPHWFCVCVCAVCPSQKPQLWFLFCIFVFIS